MPKTDVTAFAARTRELIAAHAIHAICLILAVVPAPFILYYITKLHLWGTDLQFVFQTIAFTTGIGILIYAGLRAVIWLLYAIVPVVAWLLYITVHGLALVQQLRNRDHSLTVNWSSLQKIILWPQTLLSARRNMVSRTIRIINPR